MGNLLKHFGLVFLFLSASQVFALEPSYIQNQSSLAPKLFQNKLSTPLSFAKNRKQLIDSSLDSLRYPHGRGLIPPQKENIAINGSIRALGSQDRSTITYAGSTLWAGINDVAIAGNYAYCAMDLGLMIVNIGNPSNPSFVSKIYLPGIAYGVAVAGSYAYVSDGYFGLQIINITNPSSPTLAGTYQMLGPTNGVAVAGDYAYVANYNSLRIINITNPASPTLAGSYDTPGNATDVAVMANYAYVADGSSGLQIINITNPASPTLAGSYDTPGNATDIAVMASYAYVADGSSGLQIINISNPNSPFMVRNYATPAAANGVEIAGNYVYLAETRYFQIINISNPSSPILEGTCNTYGSGGGLAVVANHAYMADGCVLMIISIANPISPTLVGTYNTYGGLYGVSVVGNYAYVAHSSGLQILDVANPASPIVVGSCPNDCFYVSNDVATVGNFAYGVGSGGFQIINISNPASPTLAGSNESVMWAYRVDVVGDYAYVADRILGLQIIDITDPSLPTLVGSYTTLGMASGVAVVGNYAYVACLDSGLQILNISNPSSPTLVGNYSSGFACDIDVVGNYAYVAGGDEFYSLKILNIINPTSPVLVGRYDYLQWAYGVTVAGNYAYVADPLRGLQIVNIANPTSPWFAGEFYRPWIFDVAVANGRAYLVSDGGFIVLSLSGYNSPSIFLDDFEGGASPLWTTIFGSQPGNCTWTVTNGIYGSGTSGINQLCLRNIIDSSWRNYIYEVDVRSNAGTSKEIAFRSQDGLNTYDVNLIGDPINRLDLNKVVNGVSTNLANGPYQSQTGVWYHLKIACVDETIAIYVNNQQILQYVDKNNPFYYGGIGLVIWTGQEGISDVSFDNTTVSDPFPHIVVDDPGRNFNVGDLITLSGKVQYSDGSAYVPNSLNIGIEDPVSSFSSLLPVDNQGRFSYTTISPANQAGAWMFILGCSTDYGVVRQAYNIPISRTLPAQVLKSTRTINAPTGNIARPLGKPTDAFSGRSHVEAFKAGWRAPIDGAKALWSSLKADVITSWQRTLQSGINRQMYQNAEMFASKCNPNNPLNGNCMNLTASYAYLFTQTLMDIGWNKAQQGIDLTHDAAPNIMDDCQYSEISTALDGANIAISFITLDYGKVIDAIGLFGSSVGVGTFIEEVEDSYGKCHLRMPESVNPYPSAAFAFDPEFGDVLIMGIIPKIPRAVVINGYSPIELTVTDPRGRYIDKYGSNIPGAEYIQFDADLDGDSEQIVIVPLDTLGDVRVSIQAAPGANPFDTFAVVANYTYYQEPLVLADNLTIAEIPQTPATVETFENLPPSAFDLVTPDDTLFSSMPCLLQWHKSMDPNPGHFVSYRIVLAMQPDFSDSISMEVITDTTYLFDGSLFKAKMLSSTAFYYWKVYAHDDWNASASSISARSFGVAYLCGDANGNGLVNIQDITFLINYLYKGGSAPNPLQAGDANGSTIINIQDITYLINYLYKGGPAPVCP